MKTQFDFKPQVSTTLHCFAFGGQVNGQVNPVKAKMALHFFLQTLT